MTAPSALKASLACGTAGAYVEVSDYLRGSEPVTISPGRTSGFDDTAPQVVAFTLDNSDGRFTPDNTASPLVLTLVEGMGVCVQIDAQLYAGTIRTVTPFFRSTLGSSAQVRVTFDDMLGNASRTDIDNLVDGINAAATSLLLWRMDESTSQTQAAEANNGFLLTPTTTGTIAFGQPAAQGLPGTQALVATTTGSGSPTFALSSTITNTNFAYPTNSQGFWHLWLTPGSLDTSWLVYVAFAGGLGGTALQFGYDYGDVFASTSTIMPPDGDGPTYISDASGSSLYYPTGASSIVGTPHLISVGITGVFAAGTWTFPLALYFDGVLVATGSSIGITPPATWTNAAKQPILVKVGSQRTGADSAVMSRLSHTMTLPHEEYAAQTTEAALLTGLALAVPEITLDTLPALSTARVEMSAGAGSVLSKMNDVIRTERGAIYTVISGTITAPVQKVKIRERTRPAVADYTFDVTEILDAPEFVRTLTNMVSSVSVRGPDSTLRVFDTSLVARVGQANTSATILNTAYIDMLAWGQDRLQRGLTRGVPVASFTVDARAINRWADLGAVKPGDRIHITGLPSQLGSSTFAGWVAGKGQSHTFERGLFTFYLDAVLPATAVYDTNRYMADGALTLSASISSTSSTSMSVATTGPKLEVVDVPYDLLVDSEQVTVTACTSATPQVATIVRGVNGTVAATHATSAVIEIATPSLYAF